MASTKHEKYHALVNKRKNDHSNKDKGYINQSVLGFDSPEIGNYSVWANALDADIMIIAQDYAGEDEYLKVKGLIQDEDRPIFDPDKAGNWSTPTNYYLYQLLKTIGRDIGIPTAQKKCSIFLTNVVLDIKKGGMSGSMKANVVKYSSETYLKPLMDIIEPKSIITLGAHAARSVLALYADETPAYKALSKANMQSIFESNPYLIRDGHSTLYTMYHPGRLGQSGRKRLEPNNELDQFELMKADWRKIK
jgi:hypothetical protein